MGWHHDEMAEYFPKLLSSRLGIKQQHNVSTPSPIIYFVMKNAYLSLKGVFAKKRTL